MHSLPLTGAWRFRQQGAEASYPAQVPGCVHTDLQRNGLIPDPFWGSNELELQWIEETDWEYAITFFLKRLRSMAGSLCTCGCGSTWKGKRCRSRRCSSRRRASCTCAVRQ